MRKSDKKIAVTFAVLGLLFTANLYAAQTCDTKSAGGAVSRERHERIEDRRQKMWDELNLTPDQKKQLEENKAKNRAAMKADFEKMKSSRESLRAELMKPELDMNKINAIQSEVKALQAQLTDNHLKSILEVRKILTHEQFEKFISLMEKHKGRER